MKKPHVVTIFISIGEDAKWHLLQKLTKRERYDLEKWVNELENDNCSFIHYYAKPFYLQLLKESEVYKKN